jgi:hypothetical protein
MHGMNTLILLDGVLYDGIELGQRAALVALLPAIDC